MINEPSRHHTAKLPPARNEQAEKLYLAQALITLFAGMWLFGDREEMVSFRSEHFSQLMAG